jgi:hypothetical protein
MLILKKESFRSFTTMQKAFTTGLLLTKLYSLHESYIHWRNFWVNIMDVTWLIIIEWRMEMNGDLECQAGPISPLVGYCPFPTRQFPLIFEMRTKAVAIPPLLWSNGLIILGSNMHLVESESSKWSCAMPVGPLASRSTEGSLLNDPSPLRHSMTQWYPLALGMNVRQNLW